MIDTKGIGGFLLIVGAVIVGIIVAPRASKFIESLRRRV